MQIILDIEYIYEWPAHVSEHVADRKVSPHRTAVSRPKINTSVGYCSLNTDIIRSDKELMYAYMHVYI